MKDIILPRKRDRYGNRIGFLITGSRDEGQKIITKLNGSRLGSSTLYLGQAKKSKSKGLKENTLSNMSKSDTTRDYYKVKVDVRASSIESQSKREEDSESQEADEEDGEEGVNCSD